MGITWCRERLEQAQNSKNPVDRILIRCSNAMKPKSYSRSQDRLADDIVFRGVRKGAETAPPRTRARLRGVSDWQTCALTVPDEEPSVAPVPPPRKKRKRKLNGDVSAMGSQELLSHDGEDLDKENAEGRGNVSDGPSRVVSDAEELTTSAEQKRQNRFVKLSENRAGGKIKTDFHGNGLQGGDRDEKQKNDTRKREHKMKVVKNVSTMSLPNYNDLVKTPSGKSDAARSGEGTGYGPEDRKPRRNQSAISLPGEGSKPILSSLSEATINRLETYMKRCRSFGSLKPQQLLEKLEEFNKTNRAESESSDSWSGLDDWDLGVIEYCDPETANVPPVTPKSTLPPRSKIFSVGTPQETRSPSPVSEEEENGRKIEISNVLDVTDVSPDNVPSDWFTDSPKKDKLEVDKPRAKTPPPSPANGLAETETVIENNESHSSLMEMLSKYKEEESSETGSVRKGSGSDESSTKEPEEKKERKLMRNRSRSLIEASLLQSARFAKRSPSIGLERTTRLLDELTRNSDINDIMMDNPENILNRLRRASMYENLPEDPFEVYLKRKKPSLSESLSVFMGFNPEKGKKEQGGGEEEEEEEEAKGGHEEDKTEGEEKPPPPLPLNPPPIITTSPADSTERPLVTVTGDEQDQTLRNTH